MEVNSNRILFADKTVNLGTINLYEVGTWLFSDAKTSGYNKAIIDVRSISSFGDNQVLRPYGAAARTDFKSLPVYKMQNNGFVKVSGIDSNGTYIVNLNNVGYWSIQNINAAENSSVDISYVLKYDFDLLEIFDYFDKRTNSTNVSGTANLDIVSNIINIPIENLRQSAILHLKYNSSELTLKGLSLTVRSNYRSLTCYDNSGYIYTNINYLAFEGSSYNTFSCNITGCDEIIIRNNNKVEGATLDYNIILCSENNDGLSRIRPNQKLREYNAVASGSKKTFGGANELDVNSSLFKYLKVFVKLTNSDGSSYNASFNLTSYEYYMIDGSVSIGPMNTIAAVLDKNKFSTELIETGAYGRRFYLNFDSNPPEGTVINCVIYGVR